MKRIQVALLVVAVMSMPALASNWVPLGNGGDGQFLVYVDLDSI